MEVAELRSETDLREAFAVMRELHGGLTEEAYARLLAEMVPDGYRLFAARDGGRIVGLVGAQVLANLYYGRHLFVYDLVVAEGTRSAGCGAALMDHVEDFARAEGCETAALACGKEREGALRFYGRRGYEGSASEITFPES